MLCSGGRSSGSQALRLGGKEKQRGQELVEGSLRESCQLGALPDRCVTEAHPTRGLLPSGFSAKSQVEAPKPLKAQPGE